jgi:outer membrane protein
MLATAAPSLAADVKICVVDAESAINATREGKAAQASLKTSYAAKESELEAKRAKLQADIEDYEQRRLILSEDARRQEEQRLEQMTQEFQMLLGQADAEMQQTYMKLLEDLQVKLLEVASSLGARQGCTVLLQKAAAIYTDSSVLDLTEMLVKEYDQR